MAIYFSCNKISLQQLQFQHPHNFVTLKFHFVCVDAHVCTCTYVYTMHNTHYICMHVHTYTHAHYIYIYARTRARANTHTHTNTHTLTQTRARTHTGCFTTCEHYCRRWFPRSMWSKSSYKHVSEFGLLWSYGHFLIPVHALMWTASYQLAGDVLNLVAYHLRCKHYFCHLTCPPIYRQSFPYLDTWKVFKECGEAGVGGYSPGSCILHDSATTMCSKTLVPYITVTVPAPDIQNSTVIVSYRRGR